MNNFIPHLLPTYYNRIVSDKQGPLILDILKQNISQKNSDTHVYKGIIKNDYVKFSKQDISRNIKSELVFEGKIFQASQQTVLEINGRYKIIPMMGYIAFICLFTLPVWPIDNPLELILPLLPYVVMVIKIKIRSKEIFNHLQDLVK